MTEQADIQGAVAELCEAMEPLCGFRPEGMSQALSLLTTRILDMMPAIEALQSLAREIDYAESLARSAE